MGLANNYEPNVMGGGAGLGGFGGGGLIEGLLLATLLGRRGGLGGDGGCTESDAIAAKVVALQNSSNLRDDICEMGTSIQSALQTQTNVQTIQFNNVREAIGVAAIAAERNANEITNLIQSQGCATRELSMANTQAILNQLAADKLDEKNDEIANLRRERDGINQQLLFSTQFNAINSVIANLVNEQKIANKVTQIGAGNTAIPVASNVQTK